MTTDQITLLEARIRRLEDIEAIRRLKAQYALLCDLKYRPSSLSKAAHLEYIAAKIAGLFTEDAVWDGGERFGVTHGRDAIRERFRNETFRFAIHYFLMPDIHVEGDSATGFWYLFQPATSTANDAMWIAGGERDEYRRVGDTWLTSRMTLELIMISPYDQGWAKHNLLA